VWLCLLLHRRRPASSTARARARALLSSPGSPPLSSQGCYASAATAAERCALGESITHHISPLAVSVRTLPGRLNGLPRVLYKEAKLWVARTGASVPAAAPQRRSDVGLLCIVIKASVPGVRATGTVGTTTVSFRGPLT
jgi:hypothetical protein